MGDAPLIITAEMRDNGKRIDSFLRERLPQFSRARIQDWIRNGRVVLNGVAVKSSAILRGNEQVAVEPAELTPLRAEPENIPLVILYEDEWLIAIDKPAGMVVHAGAGVSSGTLVNALLHRFDRLSGAGGELRPGIVHRLDRYTSGVLLVAKTDQSHRALAQLFASRRMRKTYLTVVHGCMSAMSGRVEKPIARDPVHRARMTARLTSGRAAWSEWKLIERFEHFSFLEVLIGTGRTHQIRVHLASIGHPVVEDRLYGAPGRMAGIPLLGRYFLHAHRIGFVHPFTGLDLAITSPLAPELESWLATLRTLDLPYTISK